MGKEKLCIACADDGRSAVLYSGANFSAHVRSQHRERVSELCPRTARCLSTTQRKRSEKRCVVCAEEGRPVVFYSGANFSAHVRSQHIDRLSELCPKAADIGQKRQCFECDVELSASHFPVHMRKCHAKPCESDVFRHSCDESSGTSSRTEPCIIMS